MIPEKFVSRTRALFGSRAQSIIEALSLPPLRAARVNTLKISPDDFFRMAGSFRRNELCSDGFYFDGELRGSDPYHVAGLYYIQEASAQLPVALAAADIRGRVLDLCAAPGGKTCQLAALRPDVLYSNEYVYKRASALKSNIERLGVRNALVTCNSAEDYARQLPGFFDAVVVDAPCSGEGMFRKEPAAIGNWSEANVEACAQRSLKLLLSAAETLKPGGILVYSTCTLNYEENEGVIEKFIAARDFTVLPAAVPRGAESGFLENTVRVLPDRGAGEGHFTCRMVKNYGNVIKPRQPPVRRGSLPKETWKQIASVTPWSDTAEKDGALYLAPEIYGELNYLSCGVKIFDVGKTAKPYHSLAMALYKGQTANSIDFSRGDRLLKEYLSGRELSDPPFRGWGTVTVEGFPVGLVKCGDSVKNHLPKGLYIA